MGTPFKTPEIIFSLVERTNSPVVKQRLLRCHPKGCGSKKHDCDRLFNNLNTVHLCIAKSTDYKSLLRILWIAL